MQQQQEKDYTKRFDAGLWWRLVGYMKPYHKHLIFITLTMCISAACDTIFPLLTREAIDKFVAVGSTEGLACFTERRSCPAAAARCSKRPDS